MQISVCFTHRIYPFETFEFFCSCIRGRCRCADRPRWAEKAAAQPASKVCPPGSGMTPAESQVQDAHTGAVVVSLGRELCTGVRRTVQAAETATGQRGTARQYCHVSSETVLMQQVFCDDQVLMWCWFVVRLCQLRWLAIVCVSWWFVIWVGKTCWRMARDGSKKTAKRYTVFYFKRQLCRLLTCTDVVEVSLIISDILNHKIGR